MPEGSEIPTRKEDRKKWEKTPNFRNGRAIT
jgi:hypothetical protein